MKVRHVVMGSLCVALVGSSVVFAGEGKKENQRNRKHGERSAAHFKASDTDGNGSISLSEFTAMHEKRVARMKERQGDRWDAERAAKRPSAAAIYKTMDADGSGGVSKAEMQEANKRMRARHGKRGKGKGKAGSKATPEV